MSKSFLDASIPDLVKRLKVEEKISLLGAPNWWNTTTVERLGIPSIRMSDGPNCATALASTFDSDLVKQVGDFLTQETKLKSSVVLLAPTCNIPRSPLGGRAFESFSEDPHLSGTLAAAYVNGLPSQGVSATIKHLVANDQEDERTAADSIVSERALREIYLYPFMLAQKQAQPGAYMTSYGRLKGIHCSENNGLLTDILRKEWNFGGIVMSDWFGTYGVDQSINAGLDLEMPGPPRWRTSSHVLHFTNLLTFVQQQARKNSEIVFGGGTERSRNTPEMRRFCRMIAAEGIVLLKNKGNILPLSGETPLNIAVIGPNVKERIISGGGSAALKATYAVTPWSGINDGAPSGSTINYHVGCYESNLKTPRGDDGWLCTFFAHDEHGEISHPVQQFILNDTKVKLNDFLPKGLSESWSIKLEGKLMVDKTCLFEIGLTVAGRVKLWIDGSLLIDNWTKQTSGQGTIEEKASINLVAGNSVDVLVLYTNTPPPDGDDEKGEGRLSQPALMRGVRLGGCEKINEVDAIEEAVALARRVDAVVLVGGLSPEWESEGFDRPSLQLPGRQEQLFTKVAQANPCTVVCIQAGSAVSMPWINHVNGLLQTWYSGNEAGNAIADVLFGKVNPSGRLPLTFPVRVEDVPAYLNHRSESLFPFSYREDLFVGYKHYQARGITPLFSFGFGLSYTAFSLSDLVITPLGSCTDPESLQLDVTVTVRNEGKRTGSEVVQLYVSLPETGLTTPKLQLKGFAKARHLEKGALVKLTIRLDKYAFSLWDEVDNVWHIPAGNYGLHIGPSSDNLLLNGSFKSTESFSWTGL
ncbi:hypothetical protein GALMADRAFT_221203 [Galerina marginata CBS 339.88]|uniref:beta-glucosidase n=1 Tax=Galerina marginata (strain CBS 339.88) TaxID=685588 RepID=A0A067TDP2_GALM3|nr:hypothetical protein GALMADRAFT_221203 [Galerina marginata CBS 339.88]